MSGFVNNLNQKQEDALKRFRVLMSDAWRSEFDKDQYMLRWLRARNFDVKKAEKMLRAHLAWRDEIGADTILEDYQPNEILDRYFPGGFCGHSKEGHPLWVDPTGYCDMKGIVKSVPYNEIVRDRVYLLERIYKVIFPQRSAEEGKLIEQTVVIFDLEHFGMRNMWRPGLEAQLEITKLLEANYPETMGICFVVNAPSFFPALYQIVRPFLHEATQKKIQVLGSNYKEILLRHFDADCLPARYGGNIRDPDGSPNCCTWIKYGGELPVELYITCDRSEMETELVPRGSSTKVERHVANTGAELAWEFVTDDHDLGFGVFFKPTSSGKLRDWEPVVESRRVACHIKPERGNLICSTAGTYVIRFDNSFSWTRAKRVWYRIVVQEPILEGAAETQSYRPELSSDPKRNTNVLSSSSGVMGSVESFHSAVSHLSGVVQPTDSCEEGLTK